MRASTDAGGCQPIVGSRPACGPQRTRPQVFRVTAAPVGRRWSTSRWWWRVGGWRVRGGRAARRGRRSRPPAQAGPDYGPLAAGRPDPAAPTRTTIATSDHRGIGRLTSCRVGPSPSPSAPARSALFGPQRVHRELGASLRLRRVGRAGLAGGGRPRTCSLSSRRPPPGCVSVASPTPRAHPVPSPPIDGGGVELGFPLLDIGFLEVARRGAERLRPALQQPLVVCDGTRRCLPRSRARAAGVEGARPRRRRTACRWRKARRWACMPSAPRDRSTLCRSAQVTGWRLRLARHLAAQLDFGPAMSSAPSVSPSTPICPSAGTCTITRASKWPTSPRMSCGAARRPSRRRGTPCPTSSRSRRPRRGVPRPRSAASSRSAPLRGGRDGRAPGIFGGPRGTSLTWRADPRRP